MTTNKPEMVAVMYRDGSVLTKQECGIAFDSCCNVETPLIRLSDYERLQAECERVRGMLFQCEKDRDQYERDAERYRWLSQRLVGASFDWDDGGMTILAFEMPDGVSIGADCDKNIDAAMQGDQP